tara:strand:- start:8100 stop:9362 length:1263 start_codon:yes stop_codon:yes gene_type:complete
MKETSSYFNKLVSSSFLRNVITLSAGMGLASFISFCFLFILTRLFTPEEFGKWDVFMRIIQLVAILFTLRLEMTIVLPKDQKEATKVSLLSLVILFLLSFLSLIIFFIFHDYFNSLIGNPFDSWWLILIPLGGFFLGFYNILLNWNSRFENYKKISKSNVIHSFVSSPLSAALYFLGTLGLILGQIFARVIAVYFLIHNFFSEIKKIKFSEFLNSSKNLIKKYKSFPLFEIPQSLLQRFSNDIIFYFTAFAFGGATVGILSVSEKILAKPLNIISESFKVAFYQRLTIEKNKTTFFLKSVLGMFFFGVLAVCLIYFIPVDAFKFLLGDNDWVKVGLYIKIISPLVLSRFVFVMASGAIAYKLKNHITLLWRILYCVLLIILFSCIKWDSDEELLLIYSVLGALMYLFLGILSFFVLKKNN